MISAVDDDWLEVVRNLYRSRDVWKRIARILSREGSEQRVSCFFFKSMVQVLLLFGSDTGWSPPACEGPWGGSQDQVERRLTGILPRRKPDGKWTYTSSAKVK